MAGLANLIWTLIVILVVLWLIGFLLHIGGGLIHLILVVAVILLIINLLTGRGARV
ncbi:MAG TPA: lmo0937 family membrane protein [Verrucomicrobiae bacterium]|nr:lmo0937 family membrane protein [Verrucomicrobiae bacterium]